MNDRTPPEYVPALGFHSLTRFYDAVMARLLRERAFKGRLVEETARAPGLRVLDVGCGTGTLTLALKAACPGADVTGLDIAPRRPGGCRRKSDEGQAAEYFPAGRYERLAGITDRCRGLTLVVVTTGPRRANRAAASRCRWRVA